MLHAGRSPGGSEACRPVSAGIYVGIMHEAKSIRLAVLVLRFAVGRMLETKVWLA